MFCLDFERVLSCSPAFFIPKISTRVGSSSSRGSTSSSTSISEEQEFLTTRSVSWMFIWKAEDLETIVFVFFRDSPARMFFGLPFGLTAGLEFPFSEPFVQSPEQSLCLPVIEFKFLSLWAGLLFAYSRCFLQISFFSSSFRFSISSSFSSGRPTIVFFLISFFFLESYFPSSSPSSVKTSDCLFVCSFGF